MAPEKFRDFSLRSGLQERNLLVYSAADNQLTQLMTYEWNKCIYFFSTRERAEFYEFCNLIGSGSGRNPSPGCVSSCNDLKCPFLDTESRLLTEVSLSRQTDVWNSNSNKNISVWNVQFVSRLIPSFAIKRGASQQLINWLQGGRERERERKNNKKLFTS